MGNDFRYNLSFWDVVYWTGLSNFCQSRRVHAHVLGVIVLIGTLSSNQKDVSPFPLIPKKERQAVDMHIHMKGDTVIVMFGVTFGMLIANLRIGDFQLIISMAIWKGMKNIRPQ